MKLVENKKVETNLYELTITVDGEPYAKALETSYRKNAAKITVPGFRKGKAPKGRVISLVGEDYFYEDAINASYGEAYEEALKESCLDAVCRPDVELKEVDGNAYTFVAKVTTKPEVTLGDYKGLKIERDTDIVTDENVEEELKIYADRNARMVTAAEGEEAKLGDTAVIDYEGFVNDVAFEGGKAEGHSLNLGSGQFIPGFEDQIVGHKAGESFDIKVTFPESYHSEDLAGKEAVFKIKLNEIKRKELPIVDDEFAKDVSEFDTLEEFKADIRKKLQEDKTNMADAQVENGLLEAATKNMKVDIPPVMFDLKAEDMIDEFGYRLQAQGMNMDMYMQYTGTTLDALKAQFMPQAESQVRTTLLLEAIAKAENIVVTEDEINEEYAKLAKDYDTDEEKVRKFVLKEEVIKNKTLGKAIDVIKDNAKITQKKA